MLTVFGYFKSTFKKILLPDSTSCLVELLLAIFWAVFTGFSRFTRCRDGSFYSSDQC